MSAYRIDPCSPLLHVGDGKGDFRIASPHEILAAARTAIDEVYADRSALMGSSDAQRYLVAKLAPLRDETFALLLLDTRHRVVGYVELYRGTIDECRVYPRGVVEEVLKHGCVAVIAAHNHPSGNPDPSHADRTLTEKLKEALSLIEVRLLDHIVVGGGETYSFSEHGLI